MHLKLVTVTLLFNLLESVCAVPTSPPSHVLHERREEHPEQWIRRSEVPRGHKLPVRIGMIQKSLDHGHNLLMDISNPKSSNYGKHLSAEEVIDFFAPPAATVTTISGWLRSAGIANHSQSVNKQWFQIDLPVEQLEDLLSTKYHIFEHIDTGVVDVACEEYYVPKHIQEHIDYITPGVKLFTTAESSIRKRSFVPSERRGASPLIQGPVSASMMETVTDDPLKGDSYLNRSICGLLVSPNCVRAMYNFTISKTAMKGNQLGIYQNQAQFYSQNDLNNYFATAATHIPNNTSPICHGIDGGRCKTNLVNPTSPESELDLQAALPIIYPQNAIVFQTDDLPTENNYVLPGIFNNFFDAIDGSYCKLNIFNITGNSPGVDPSYPNSQPGGWNHSLQCGVYKPTNVLSLSYSVVELDPGIPLNYQRRQCYEIMKLGLQGVTTVVASGDSGVQSFKGCLGKKYNVFSPEFPGSCPYALAVGSTTLPPGGKAAKDEETATTTFASGGGFSNIFERPSYQNASVQHYLTTYPPKYKYYETTLNKSVGTNGGIYNRIGRAYPDVSAVGQNYAIYVADYPFLSGGTSLSTPIVASLLTRINEERLRAGKNPVGFVNQVFYQHPEIFHDITQGRNPGCNTYGFNATPGFDPVTGLGTPNFPAMLNLFMSLP